MFKVTIKYTLFFTLPIWLGCNSPGRPSAEEDSMRKADAASEARIDSAYKAIAQECDSLLLFTVPMLVDALIRHDSLVITGVSDTFFYDTDQKAEKVIRQLKADCNANLLKETYKRYRQQQLLKPRRHRKVKA